MDVALQVALATSGGAVGVAVVTAVSTRSVRRVNEKVAANEAELEAKRFSMEYFERMAEAAVAEAERWKQQAKEEQAIAVAFSGEVQRLKDRLAVLQHRLDRADTMIRRVLREHPDIEDDRDHA